VVNRVDSPPSTLTFVRSTYSRNLRSNHMRLLLGLRELCFLRCLQLAGSCLTWGCHKSLLCTHVSRSSWRIACTAVLPGLLVAVWFKFKMRLSQTSLSSMMTMPLLGCRQLCSCAACGWLGGGNASDICQLAIYIWTYEFSYKMTVAVPECMLLAAVRSAKGEAICI
jgi:hypothetical protein